MKLSHPHAIVLLLLTHLAMAECNTVMGGCVKEDTINVAPHMRTETLKKVEKPATNNKAPANMVSSTPKVKVNTKKL